MIKGSPEHRVPLRSTETGMAFLSGPALISPGMFSLSFLILSLFFKRENGSGIHLTFGDRSVDFQ